MAALDVDSGGGGHGEYLQQQQQQQQQHGNGAVVAAAAAAAAAAQVRSGLAPAGLPPPAAFAPACPCCVLGVVWWPPAPCSLCFWGSHLSGDTGNGFR